MSRILTAWELGAGLGHIDRMQQVARELRQRGHDVRMLLRDLSRAHARLAGDGWWFAQAPLWLPRLTNPPQLVNYTAVLAAAGWLEPAGLAGLVRAWRAQIALIGPDAIVCDHAPTAMLAARGLGLPVLAVGNSFEIPPPGDHFMPMAYWNPALQAVCASQDALLLGAANQALALLGDPPLARLTDLFAGVHRVVMSLPELAHYEACPPADIAGPSFVADSGAEPQWPAGPGPKVFAYLAPSHAQFGPAMAALKSLGWPTLVYGVGLSAEAVKRLGSSTLRLQAQPLRMEAVLAQARIVISHAGVGTVTAAALAGVPQLMLPQHMEQQMTARRVTQAGSGLTVPAGDGPAPWAALLKRLAQEPAFTQAAQALAQRNAGLTPQRSAAQVADRIDAAMALRETGARAEG